MDVSSKIIAIAFYFFALLYIWLKIRDVVHENVDIAFDKHVPEDPDNEDEQAPTAIFPLTNISGTPMNMLVRIILIISLFTLFLFLFSSVVKWMLFTKPINLENTGMMYMESLQDGPPLYEMSGPVVDANEYVWSIIMTLFNNIALIFKSVLLTMALLYMYAKFAINLEDWTSREGMHMHVDIFLFIALFIQFYVIHIIFSKSS
jgi:hypothetical protein